MNQECGYFLLFSVYLFLLLFSIVFSTGNYNLFWLIMAFETDHNTICDNNEEAMTLLSEHCDKVEIMQAELENVLKTLKAHIENLENGELG